MAEQLATFCDDILLPNDRNIEGKLGEDEWAYVDESFVLPIVSQLDGVPQVTEDGDIVYTFPELMTTSSSSTTASPRMYSKEMACVRRESRMLRLAGLEEDAPTRDIKWLLDMNGINTWGAINCDGDECQYVSKVNDE